MKILIAYDGSDGANAALDDLARAGLPPDCEAMVLTVADAPVALAGRVPSLFGSDDGGSSDLSHRRLAAAEALRDAQTVAAGAAARLRARFPGWSVSADAWGGTAGSAIVLKSDLWQPDLVVVGSRGRSRPARLLLGSVARKVVTEARCSLRIARAPVGSPGTPVRVLVGHDGGAAGRSALLAAASRAWPAESRIRAVVAQEAEVLAALAPGFDGGAAWPLPETPADAAALQVALDADVRGAQRPGVSVTAEVAFGPAASVLLRTARKWGADCVFVGATSRSRASRFLLGSVSAAVADRARCSVEIVRANAR